MSAIEVTTQAQLDKALKTLKSGDYVVCVGGTRYDPLTVRGSSHVVAWGSSHVEASKFVAVHKHGSKPKVNGGVLIEVPDPSTLSAADWCGFYGIPVKRGSALLSKALDDDLSTPQARRCGIVYTVGAKVKCADWRSTKACGNGLHVSPRPEMARIYNEAATRYVQVKVSLADLVVIDDKAKVPALSVVCECDRNGNPLVAA